MTPPCPYFPRWCHPVFIRRDLLEVSSSQIKPCRVVHRFPSDLYMWWHHRPQRSMGDDGDIGGVVLDNFVLTIIRLIK
jgi:hypothetical protein